MDLAYRLARPIFFSADPEVVHTRVLGLAGRVARHPAWLRAISALYAPKTARSLEVEAFGLRFPNPVGLAAGLDKDGEAIDLWAAFGFGFVELGTVTPGSGQPGNDKPRLERLIPDEAIVNRMGFNNRGAPQLAARLAARRSTIPAGANLGKAKVTPLEAAPEDYAACLEAVFDAASYVVINVSSPNTPGLRDLQAVSSLGPLLRRVVSKNRALAEARKVAPRPILLKIAPDLADPDVDEAADLALAEGLSGIIATNTTLRHDLAKTRPTIAGGLSGRPLRPRALELVRRLYRRLGPKLPIVGVGGIGSADDAYERIKAGARLVQIYTALIYAGPGVVASIVEGLAARLERDGFASVERAVGTEA